MMDLYQTWYAKTLMNVVHIYSIRAASANAVLTLMEPTRALATADMSQIQTTQKIASVMGPTIWVTAVCVCPSLQLVI